MAKRRARAKPVARAVAGITAEVTEAWVKLHEEAFFELMMAIVKAEPYEAHYGKFEDSARALTKEQLRRIARYAAEYYVREANLNRGGLPSDEIQRLKVRAIGDALNRLADE
jgi:hypothetical protein